MAVTEQEKRSMQEALKREIQRQKKLISMYERAIGRSVKIEGGEREVLRCEKEIERCKHVIVVAAAQLGYRPQEEPPKPRRGRPPKNPSLSA